MIRNEAIDQLRRNVDAWLSLDLDTHLQSRPPDPDAFVFTAADGGPLRHCAIFRARSAHGGTNPVEKWHQVRTGNRS